METAAGFRVEYSLDGNTWRTEPYTATNVADSVLIYYRTFYAGYEQIADSCTLKIRPSVETSGGGKPTVTSGNDEGVTYHYAGIEGTDYDSKDPPSTPGKYRLTTTTKEGIVTTYDFTINEPINITAIAVGIAVGAFVLIVCVAVFVVALKKRKQQAQAMAS